MDFKKHFVNVAIGCATLYIIFATCLCLVALMSGGISANHEGIVLQLTEIVGFFSLAYCTLAILSKVGSFTCHCFGVNSEN